MPILYKINKKKSRAKEENKIEVFNYKKYIKTIHTLHFGDIFHIAEPQQTYNLIEKEKNNIVLDYEEVIKKVLSDKNEVANFINDFLYPKEKLKANNLKRCETKKIKDNQIQLIYKISSKHVYYMIEVQKSEKDEEAVNKLISSCMEIMGYAIKKGRLKQKIIYPTIYPVIICLQENNNSEIKSLRQQKELSTISEVEFTYNIIKIKELSEEKLLSKNTLINKVLFAKKTKNVELLQEVKKNIVNIQTL